MPCIVFVISTIWLWLFCVFSTRSNIYISRLCHDTSPSVCPSVYAAAVLLAGESSRAMLASARLSCYKLTYIQYIAKSKAACVEGWSVCARVWLVYGQWLRPVPSICQYTRPRVSVFHPTFTAYFHRDSIYSVNLTPTVWTVFSSIQVSNSAFAFAVCFAGNHFEFS